MPVYKIRVRVKGRKPILMHNPKGIFETARRTGRKRGAVDIPNPEEEAEAGAYRLESGELYIPSEWFLGAMREAAKSFRVGRSSAWRYVVRSCEIVPDKIPLGTDKYEIDIRPVVVQRSRVLRARPRIDNWQVEFDIIYNYDLGMIDLETLKRIIKEAGYIGIGDYRPRFGLFDVEFLGVEEI